MSLTLYYHPLSSFCQKVVAALYENDTAFEPLLIDLGNPESRAKLLARWPIGKFPVLHDSVRDWTVPESSIIIEYLALHYPGRTQLLPADPEMARQVRMRDRFYDLHVQVPMQKIVGDRLRPADGKDPVGLEQARGALRTALDMVDRDMRSKTWAVAESFSMADCAAAPALYYANLVMPFAASHPDAARYLDRLSARPAIARTFADAGPYRHMFPKE